MSLDGRFVYGAKDDESPVNGCHHGFSRISDDNITPFLFRDPIEGGCLPMNTIERILVACDLSLETRDLLSFGILLAEKYHARLVLVHVIEQGGSSFIKRLTGIDRMRGNKPSTEALTARLRKRRYLELERLVKSIGATPYIERRVVLTGLAHRKILEHAAQSRVDLILAGVGHAGQRPNKAIGTTVKQLIRQSTVPVLILSGRLVTEDATATLGAVDRPAA